MSADGRFILQNGNKGLRNHNYFDRQKYQAKFEIIWDELRKISFANQSLVDIKNSDIFKYSPYKALSPDQQIVAEQIVDKVERNISQAFLVHGGPGTGKTILATYLVKRLVETPSLKEKRIGLVVPMTSLRNTLKKVFKHVPGLKPLMVIGPSEVVSGYDILIVDEAHRLRRRKNITNYQSFDSINRKMKLGNIGTELDWILKCSKSQIFFYDENQSVRPSDVPASALYNLKAEEFYLQNQLRISVGVEGEKYITFVQDLFDMRASAKQHFSAYDFRIYEDIQSMVRDIKKLDEERHLARLVSGLAWPWVSKKNPSKHDIEIEGVKLKWNSINHNWVHSKNAINEVGCIHTVQGYDLNYAGVIIGPELSYDFGKKQFVIYPEKYTDMNGRRGIEDPKELERYILNVYKTLLTRGIEGTFVYIVDENLRKYFKTLVK